MSLYRSAEMTLCQLFLQAEAAYTSVSELGELGLVQFRELNPDVNAFQRKFVSEVRRCDEMERKLRYLEAEIKRDGIPILDTGDNPPAPLPKEMIDLEANFEKLEIESKEINTNAISLKRNYLELSELKCILERTEFFFGQGGDNVVASATQALAEDDSQLISLSPHSTMQLGFVAGMIQLERMLGFERLLWRACRGNVFIKFSPTMVAMEDPVTGDQVTKAAFVIFFQGEQLKTRVKKICEGYRATLYPCPEGGAERAEMEQGVRTRLVDLQQVLQQTQEHRHRVLVHAARNIRVWFVKVRKIKAIYHTMNMFNVDVSAQNCFIAECWCPIQDLGAIQQALSVATDKCGSAIPSIMNRLETKQSPPTYFKTNRFTAAFQAIIDAYGVATYREVNPALFTIISFPFLFAMMFGDAGHGLIVFLIALYMVVNERKWMGKKSDNEIWKMLFGGRYIILLMGTFSVYTGLVYNDVFAKSINVFGSAWYPSPDKYDNKTLQVNKLFGLDPATDDFRGLPYYVGMDPIWQMSTNKITFLNSFKMKLSIIFGIMHMVFGVVLSLANHIHFKNGLNVVAMFIPEILFLLSIFGYLVGLIFYKWLAYDATTGGTAPSLLIHLINMFLMNYPTSPPSSVVFYPGQQTVQLLILVVAAVCAVTILTAKPIVLYLRHSARLTVRRVRSTSETAPVMANEQPPGTDDVEDPSTSMGARTDDDDDDEFVFGEIVINQAIHTIEYCLNCVSHTASYLRLWALSLAHAELSEVLWTMVMRIGLNSGGYVGAALLPPIFAFWAGATVAILLLMEGLSAFLHCIRLHWVEFQSKFYGGNGYAFQPFCFAVMLDQMEEES